MADPIDAQRYVHPGGGVVTVRVLPMLWVGPYDGTTPLGVDDIHTSAAEVLAWLEHPGGTPLEHLRCRGADIDCSSVADRSTRSAVRAVRMYLQPRRATALAAFADDLGLSLLATRLRSWPLAVPLTLETIAASVRTTPFDETSRIFLALEHL